jgi:hypothetical protein
VCSDTYEFIDFTLDEYLSRLSYWFQRLTSSKLLFYNLSINLIDRMLSSLSSYYDTKF